MQKCNTYKQTKLSYNIYLLYRKAVPLSNLGHNRAHARPYGYRLITFTDPDSLRRSRVASFFSFFSMAFLGLALALLALLIFFFSASVSLSFLGGMMSQEGGGGLYNPILYCGLMKDLLTLEGVLM